MSMRMLLWGGTLLSVLAGFGLSQADLAEPQTPPTLPQENPQRLELNGPPSCKTCRIVVEKELSIGGMDAPGIGQFFVIARDARGRFIVSHQEIPDEIAVYDSTGEYLRTVGRKGQGPGEWLSVADLSVVGEYLIVTDNQNARETVLDSNFDMIRTTPTVGIASDLVFLSDSIKVANMLISSPELVGYTLHTIDGNGSIRSSFGLIEGAFRSDSRSEGWRQLSASRDGTVWAGHSRRYQLEEWTLSGEKLLTLERSVEWFPTKTGPDSWSPDEPPDPMMEEVWEDARGLLWVAVSLADPEWKEALSRTRGGGYQALQSEYLDRMVEVIDPHAGEVLTQMRCDWVGPFIGGGRMATYREDESGFPYLDIFKVRLDRGERD